MPTVNIDTLVAELTTSTQYLQITADDYILAPASYWTGAGLQHSNTPGAVIGMNTAANGVQVEFLGVAMATGAGMIVGDDTVSGDIRVVNSQNSNLVTGAVLTLLATKDDSRVYFETMPSTFGVLDVVADNGIATNADLTTTVGSLAMNGDSDSTVDTEDGIFLNTASVDRTIRAKTVMTLRAKSDHSSWWGPDSSCWRYLVCTELKLNQHRILSSNHV